MTKIAELNSGVTLRGGDVPLNDKSFLDEKVPAEDCVCDVHSLVCGASDSKVLPNVSYRTVIWNQMSFMYIHSHLVNLDSQQLVFNDQQHEPARWLWKRIEVGCD